MLPVTLLAAEAGLPSELRDAILKEYVKPGQKRYLFERRIRELSHELKTNFKKDKPDSSDDYLASSGDEQL
jgi:hypothetical protein